MSCDGVMIGLPLAGEKMLFGSQHQHVGFCLDFDRDKKWTGHSVESKSRQKPT